MILGVGFSLVIFGAGWLVMRPLRLGKEPTSFGLAPALGFAALAAISAARAMFGFAPLLGTVAVVGIGVAGLTTAAVDAWGARLHVSAIREHRLAFVLLACALAVPICVSAV